MEEKVLFSKESNFLDILEKTQNKIYCSVYLSSQYSLTPELLMSKNYQVEYLDSVEINGKIYHKQGIFKNKSNIYLYLAKSKVSLSSYEIKVFYESEKMSEALFFIKNLNKLKENGN